MTEGVVAIELGGSAGCIAERDNAAKAVGMVEVICNALLHGQRFVNAGAMGVSGFEVVCSVVRQKDVLMVINIPGDRSADVFLNSSAEGVVGVCDDRCVLCYFNQPVFVVIGIVGDDAAFRLFDPVAV